MTAKKGQAVQAIRGMNDLLPADSGRWRALESTMAEVFHRHGYQQIRTPIVEKTALFARSIGADTDIVSKEMYTFEDRNGTSLTLRPEGTASCVRAGIEHGLLYNQQSRLWYIGPMFRHERPQKGRYRQFHQAGVECFGWDTPDIEAEVIALVVQLFDALGLKDYRLELNSLGDTASRAAYRTSLQTYFRSVEDQLDEDSLRRLDSNPLRILDSKNPDLREVINGAPTILDALSDDSKAHFEELQFYLDELNIDYVVSPTMVRGLDYYNDTVFEFICDDFGAQATVCGGGRYDGLVTSLGGPATPAFGFGLGLERLVQILEEQGAELKDEDSNSVFIVSDHGPCRATALRIRQSLAANGIRCLMAMGQAGFKNQFKRADKSGALLAIVIGEEEFANGQVQIKFLNKPDENIVAAAPDLIKQALSDGEQQFAIALESAVEQVTNLMISL
ncbi:MAG: histidine--tRNA ligase [Pseudomonadota bacterium]